jgi:phage baseplate assembly protein V
MNGNHAPALFADNRFFGVAEALVVDVVDPDGECRIRVKFPWLDSKQETEWCRCASLFAGNGYGSTWTPEVGDEVLVAFVHGHLGYPVVIGGLYNGEDKPPTKRGKATNTKMFRTKVGHTLSFDDSDFKHAIRLTSADGHLVELDDANGRVSLKCKSGVGITIDNNTGELTINATTIKITATGDLTIKGTKVSLNP